MSTSFTPACGLVSELPAVEMSAFSLMFNMMGLKVLVLYFAVL